MAGNSQLDTAGRASRADAALPAVGRLPHYLYRSVVSMRGESGTLGIAQGQGRPPAAELRQARYTHELYSNGLTARMI